MAKAKTTPDTDTPEAEVVAPEMPEQTGAPQEQPPGLDLQDISAALNLVNVAIKRGAYERTELRQVLDVTDKLDVFLNYQAQAQAAMAAQKGE